MKHTHCAHAYRRTSVNTTSPGNLILMLFDGALRFMKNAETGLDDADPIRGNETVHNNLLKTQAIFDELQLSLDRHRGGDFAHRMWNLYDFMRGHLVKANLHKDAAAIQVVAGLLGDIRQSWAQMLTRTDHIEASARFSTAEPMRTAA